MRVLARAKPLEQLPEEASCCPKMVEELSKAIERLGTFTVDLSQQMGHIGKCRWCGKSFTYPPGSKWAVIVDGYYARHYINLSLVELNEGGMELPHEN